MNEEIKEILDYLNKFINDKEEITKYGCEISVKQAKQLLDYITNLQQIEQEHQRINGELREENSKLEIALQNIQEDYDRRIEENERLKEDVKLFKSDLISCTNTGLSLITKIDKAIEYIKTEASYSDFRNMCEGILDYEKVNILLNILQNGSDDNE